MKGAASASKRILIGLAAIVQLLCFPVVTFADSPSSAGAETNSIAQPMLPSDNNQPTDVNTDAYTLDQSTGLWENEYYTWDPATKQTSPKTPPAYSFNPTTGKWHSTGPPTAIAAPEHKPQLTSESTAASSDAAKQQAAEEVDMFDAPAPVQSDTLHNGSHSSLRDVSMANTISLHAQSGNASVTNNTLGGNAASGNALAIANVLNVLQSSWGMSPAEVTTFMADINGDVMGDLLLDPALFTSTEIAPGIAYSPDITVNSSSNSSINNNIAVHAQSGNTTVTGNTAAGDAISGPAAAVVNIINLINTHISAGQSFVGNININGNLEGDILLPENLQQALLAHNVPTASIPTASLENGELLADFTDTQSIENTVNLTAQSGDTAVTGNTAAGSATTGNSETNLTVFNLTSSQVVASNALLVFVNVLGEWVGMIVDAPAGSTAAMIGGGVASGRSVAEAGSIAGRHTNTNMITNTVNVDAHSGSAAVHDNTQAGRALSGNATASANIANISGSQFSLADWFGVLFINVLGSWHGSFGINTTMGNPNTRPPAIPTPIAAVKVFQIQRNPVTGTHKITASVINTQTSKQPPLYEDAQDKDTPRILGTGTSDGSQPPSSTNTQPSAADLWLGLAVISLALLLFAAIRVARRRATIRTAVAERQAVPPTAIRPNFL